MPDGFIVVAPSNDTYMPGVSQYDMVFAVSSNIQGFAFGGSNMYMQITSNGQINVGGSIVPLSNIAYDLGTSNNRFRDMYLSGNTIDIGGVRISKDSVGSLKVTDSNGSNASIVASQVLIGTDSNSLVTLKLDSNNSLQFVSATVSNGVVVESSNATVVGGGGGGGGSGGGWTAAGTSVYVGPGSNVGIGVTTPQAGLHVASNLRVDGNIAFTGFEVVPGTAANGFVQNSNQWFSMSSNVYITGSNVAVGKNTAAYPLDVVGDVNFSGILRQGGVPYVGSQWSNVTSNIFVLGSNVGIGVSNARAMLHVACNLQVDGSIQMGSYMMFGGIDLISGSNPMSNSSGVVLSANGVQGYSNAVYGVSGSNGTVFSIMSNTANDSWRWVSGAASNEVARLTGAGRLGVGVSAPAYTLDVGGDLNFSGTLRQGGAPYVGSQWSNTTSNVFLLGSNVGIGKNNPLYPLDVLGDLNFSGTLRQGGLPYVGSQWSNSTSNVFLMGSNVAIGKSNATSALDVAGTVTISSNLVFGGGLVMQGINIQKNTGVLANITSTTVTGLSNDTLGTVFSIPSNGSTNYFKYVANTTEVCRITGDGKVGIGVAGPGETLSVQGNISLSNTGSKVVCSVDSSNNLLVAACNIVLGSVANNTVGNVCAGNLGLGRNRIVNGNMGIANTGSNMVITNTGTFSTALNLDKWSFIGGPNNTLLTGGVFTILQNSLASTDAPYPYGLSNSMKVTVTTAPVITTGSYMYLSQTLNTWQDLCWGTGSGSPVTVSFWFKTNMATNNVVCITLQGWNGTTQVSYSYHVTVAASGSWQYSSFTVPAPPSSAPFQSIFVAFNSFNGSRTANLNTWENGNYIGTTTFYGQNFWSTLNNYIEFTGVQVEEGRIATPFELRPPVVESLLNQNLVLGSVSAGNVGNVCAGNLGMFRNRIINGDMRVDQRNGGATLSPAAHGSFPVDRTLVVRVSAATMNVGQSNIAYAVPGFKYALKSTVATASATIATSDVSTLYAQTVEANNLSDLMQGTSSAQPFVVSFWMFSTIAHTFYLSIRNSTPSRSYVTPVVASANTWRYYSFAIPGDTTSTGWSQDGAGRGIDVFITTGVGSSRLTSTANQWQNGDLWGLTSDNTFINVAGAYTLVTGVQIEKGTIATPFEFRPYALELQLCQRYFYKWGGVTKQIVGWGFSDYTNNRGEALLQYAQTMRGTPTITSSAAANFAVVAGTGGTQGAFTGTGTVFDTISPTSARMMVLVGTTITQGQVTRLEGSTSAAVVNVDAEL